MSEDTKKRELLNEDALDNVAGGSNEQNYEILNAMQKIDSDAVMGITAQARQAQLSGGETAALNVIADGASSLLQKHFGNEIGYTVTQKQHSNQYYSANNERMTHKQVIDMINYKAELSTWEIS